MSDEEHGLGWNVVNHDNPNPTGAKQRESEQQACSVTYQQCVERICKICEAHGFDPIADEIGAWLSANLPKPTPATPSADEEIERIADLLHDDVSKVFHRSLAADSRPVIRERLEELAALLSASHTNEREEVNSWKTWGEQQSETARKLSYQNDNLVRDLSTREGEIERLKEKVANQAKVWSTELSALQAELEASNKTIQALQEELEYCPACATAKAELATAQSTIERMKYEMEQTVAGDSFWFSVPHRKLVKAWDRVIDRIPGLSRKLSLGTLDELAEHLGVAPRNDNSDEYIVVKETDITALRSQLTEAQAELQQKKDALFEAGFSTTKRILELDAQLTEANAKLAEAAKLIGDAISYAEMPFEAKDCMRRFLTRLSP